MTAIRRLQVRSWLSRLSTRRTRIGFFVCAGLLLVLLLHAATLTRFPFVHSDEVWLASLTRSMLEERSFTATEEFFRLTDRHPHAIKTLFHLIQMPAVLISFSAVSVRLISVIAALGMVIAGWFAGTGATRTVAGGTGFASILAVEPILFAASHIARQEIVLALILVTAIAIYERRRTSWTIGVTIGLGTLLGAGAFIHPNACIVALPFPLLVLIDSAAVTAGVSGEPYDRPVPRIRRSLTLVMVLLVWAALALGASLAMDPVFVRHYLAFGAEVGVDRTLFERFTEFPKFYLRLFRAIGGTYFVPVAAPTLLIGIGAMTVALPVALLDRDAAPGIRRAGILLGMINAGILIVGKYSQPVVALVIPPLVLLCIQLIASLRRRQRRLGTVALGAILSVCVAASVVQLAPWIVEDDTYRRYLDRIEGSLPPDVPVLANLNTGFAFTPGRLHTWSDLDSLSSHGLTVSEYLELEDIAYIMYPEELDVIYRERPIWNSVYGNLYPWYDEMQRVLSERYELIGAFASPVYAMRLIPYLGSDEWLCRVYRVRDD